MTSTLWTPAESLASSAPADIAALAQNLQKLHISALVFDLDGNLVHSANDLIEGMRRSFRALGVGELPGDYWPEQLHGTMEGIMRTACADMGWAQPADMATVMAHFVPEYTAMQAPTAQLYAGVKDVVDALAACGIRMAVCTNSSELSANNTLKKMGLHSQMGFVCGANTFGVAKPHATPLLGTLHVLGVPPEQCLYVGDTEVDAQCAQAAGARFAWHAGGYGNAQVAAYPQALQFEHWAQLAAYLRGDAA